MEPQSDSTPSFPGDGYPALPIEKILQVGDLEATEPSETLTPLSGTEGEVIGLSRQGREIHGFRLGSGPRKISLIGGCHADEPVGPDMLRRLTEFLVTRAPDHPLLRWATWYLVPHVNPDGASDNQGWAKRRLPTTDHLGQEDQGYEIAPYLRGVVRELPGDDMEWGFPLEATDRDARPENLAVADFLRPGAPFSLHASFHSMGFAAGPWFLLEPGWVDATQELRSTLTTRVESMGYLLHDVDRKGEKGFHRIGPGFCTRPDSRAMAAHFIEKGDAETAAAFRPSSMEWVGSLGGDPLTLVSEMPLFLLPTQIPDLPDAPPHPTGTEGRLAFLAWTHRRMKDLTPEDFRLEVKRFGLRPMPLRDQMRLQLGFLDEGLRAISTRNTPLAGP